MTRTIAEKRANLRKGKLYVAVFNDKDGNKLMAWRDCHRCGGRGLKGRQVCKCIRLMRLPIDFITLYKRKLSVF
jgi:hypothetical protein